MISKDIRTKADMSIIPMSRDPQASIKAGHAVLSASLPVLARKLGIEIQNAPKANPKLPKPAFAVLN